MDEFPYLRHLAWIVYALLLIVLLFFVVRRRAYRLYPAFSACVLLVVAQNLVGLWLARHWGTASMQYFNIAWGMQAVVVCARWLAALEVARRVLGIYPGIWRRANRVLLVLSVLIPAYVLAVSLFRWNVVVVLNTDRAVHLCIAIVMIGILALAAYYRMEVTNAARQLAMGFALFSCAWLIGNSLDPHTHYLAAWWDFFQELAYMASLVLWINAVRRA